MKLRRYMDTKLAFQVSPLVDIVVLLRIYFLVTSSLIKKEAALAFSLPPTGQIVNDLPVEVRVEIAADGTVELEGIRFPGNDRALNDLVAQISGLKNLATSQQSKFYVSIMPHKDTLHRRVIDVMDACAAAGVNHLAFSKSM